MKLAQVKELLTQAVLDERERCARIADDQAKSEYDDGGYSAATQVAELIRSANPPSIRVVRPETAIKMDALPPGTIVAGQGLDDQGNIIGNGA